MSFLLVELRRGKPVRFPLRETTVRIGRLGDNDLVLPDETVSRHEHARIERRPDGHYIVHVEGKNETLVNGRRISGAVRLVPGDRIRLGQTELLYDPPPSTQFELSDEPWTVDSATKVLRATEITRPGSPSAEGPPSLDTAEALWLVLEADRTLAVDRPLDEIFDAVLDLAARVVPFERGVLMTLDGGEPVDQAVRASASAPARPISRGVLEHVLRRKEAVLSTDVRVDPNFRGQDSLIGQGIRCFLCAPMLLGDQVLGLLYADSRDPAARFTEKGLHLLTHLAFVAAARIENRRIHDRLVESELVAEELRSAAEIQAHLLPASAPAIDGYSLHGSSQPSRAVGGDYYDFLALPGRRVGLALGDVAGKGLPAALIMCSFQSSVQALVELDLDPAELAGRLNRLLERRLPSNRFVTFLYAALDPVEHRLVHVNAGQGRPHRIRADGRLECLSQGGMPLGMFGGAEYGAHAIGLEPGDVVLCYSDGATDARNRTEQPFGEQRLLEAASRRRDRSAREIVESLRDEIERHTQAEPRLDDITLLVLKRDG